MAVNIRELALETEETNTNVRNANRSRTRVFRADTVDDNLARDALRVSFGVASNFPFGPTPHPNDPAIRCENINSRVESGTRILTATYTLPGRGGGRFVTVEATAGYQRAMPTLQPVTINVPYAEIISKMYQAPAQTAPTPTDVWEPTHLTVQTDFVVERVNALTPALTLQNVETIRLQVNKLHTGTGGLEHLFKGFDSHPYDDSRDLVTYTWWRDPGTPLPSDMNPDDTLYWFPQDNAGWPQDSFGNFWRPPYTKIIAKRTDRPDLYAPTFYLAELFAHRPLGWQALPGNIQLP